MSAGVALRPATPDDAHALALQLGQLGYPCSGEEARARIAALAGDERQSLIVAEVGGVAAGFLALAFHYYLPLGRRSARITTLVVDAARRHAGIGRRLVQEAERRAGAAGAARLEVTSARHREDAHRFYAALGYTNQGLRFVKPLPSASAT